MTPDHPTPSPHDPSAPPNPAAPPPHHATAPHLHSPSWPPPNGPVPAPPPSGPLWTPAPNGTSWTPPGGHLTNAAPPPPVGTNGFALASFILGLLGGLLFSFVFGLVALSQIRKTRQGGRGLAVAGLVLSGVWLAVFIGFAVTTDDEPAGNLAVGDCFNDRSTGSTVAWSSLHPVPCTEPHNAEVVGVDTGADRAYPGETTLQAQADPLCSAATDRYVLDPMSLPPATEVLWIVPLEDSWDLGDRTLCFLGTGETRLTRSLRQDASDLTPEQLRYLDAVRGYNKALNDLDAADGATTFPDLRALAGQVADAQSKELAALAAGPWPSTAQPSIDRLIATGNAEIARWRKAAQAASGEELGRLLDDADRQLDNRAALAARSALGLPTQPGQPAGRPGVPA